MANQPEEIFFSNDERKRACAGPFPGEDAETILDWYMNWYEHTQFGGGLIEKNCVFSLDILQELLNGQCFYFNDVQFYLLIEMMTLRLLDNEVILKKISLTGENAYLKMIKDIIEGEQQTLNKCKQFYEQFTPEVLEM